MLRSLTFKLSFVLLAILSATTAIQTFRVLSDVGRQWFLRQKNLGATVLQQAQASPAKILEADLGPLAAEEGEVALRLLDPNGRLLDQIGKLDGHPAIGVEELAKMQSLPIGGARLIVPFYEGLALGLRIDTGPDGPERYLVYSQTLEPARWVQLIQRLARRNLLVSTLIASGAGLLLARWLRKRLSRLAEAFRQVAAGNFSTRVPMPRERELGELAGAFNEMAAELEKAQELRRRAEDERRTFMGQASHELRTPLTALQGYLETLTMDGFELEAGQRRNYLDKAFLEAQELGHRVEDLMELVRLERPAFRLQFAATTPLALFEELARRYEPIAAAAGVQLLGLQLDEAAMAQAKLLADRRRLVQALGNLLHNAIKASPRSGRIEVHPNVQGAWIEVRIEDQGPGLAGYTSEEGLGLGLRIAKTLLERHGGELSLEQRSGLGLRARARWPLAGNSP